MTRLMSMLVAIAFVASFESASGHGYMAGPRSRNLLAFEETVWWPQTENDPSPETCPHCLNRGGSLAQCGIAQGTRNYDAPLNALGGPMPTSIQATYSQAQEIVINVTLTAHHKGHFEFAACPISTGEIPTKECFDQNKLTFVEDLMYGANYDPNYPHRAYIAPVSVAVDGVYIPNYGTTKGLMNFSFKMRLPSNVYGDLVLIQWYYLTANSCIHDGYTEYNWPEGWKEGSLSASLCGDVSTDGEGSPEQFWNCAETRILANSNSSLTSSSKSSPTNSPTSQTLTASVAIPVSSLSSSSHTSHDKTIIGYYASWQWYDRNRLAAPENMDFTKLQRVNYAFFQTDTSGNLWGTDSWGDPNVLFGPYNWNPSEDSNQYCSWDSPTERPCNYHNYEQGLIYLVHAAGTEIFPSIGGWTLSDPFPAMAANPTARATFAENCVGLIQAYDFDGIDIDWEYPGFEEHSGTSDDKANFVLLLDEVRSKLDELGAQTGRVYGLTAALPCGPSHIANIDIAHVASTLSELNLMTYDFHGAFSETTGTNAPLYYQGWGEEDFSVHDCVQNWLAGGGTKDKINIGLPFYGRSFAGATQLNQLHDGADQTVWGIDDGTPQYFNIMAQLPSMTLVWDKTTWTDWAYFESGGSVSFDGEDAICAKAQYAIENELNGFIIWELSGDLMDDLSTPLLDVVNEKLADPSYSCGEPGYYPGEAGVSTSVTYAGTNTSQYTTGASTSVIFSWTEAPQYTNDASTSVTLAGTESPQYTTDTSTSVVFPSPSVTDLGGIPDSSLTDSFSEEARPSSSASSAPPSFTSGASPSVPTVTNPADPTSTSLFINCDPSSSSDSQTLELSFSYELHRHPLISSTTAMEDVKISMLHDIAGNLGCDSGPSSSTGRTLSDLGSNATTSIQDYVVAILSQPSDVQNVNSPCSIAVNLDSPSVCDSMMGSLTVLLDSNTSDSLVQELRETILFTIRTGMASGRYETSNVLKVIFIEDLTVNPLQSHVSSSMVEWVSEPEGMSTSTIIVIVLCVLLIIITGIAQLLFLKRARSVQDTEQDHHAENSVASSVSQVEEVWKKALDTYDSKTAIDPNGGYIVTLGTDSSDNCSVELSQEVERDEHLVAFDKALKGSDPPKSNEESSDAQTQDEDEYNHKNTYDSPDDLDEIVASCLPMCDANVLSEQTARAPPRESTNVSSMKISELKRELEMYGIDISGLIEKQEFVDAVKAARRRKSKT